MLFVVACMLVIGAVGYMQMRFVLVVVPTMPLMMTPVLLGGIVGALLLRTWRYKQAALSANQLLEEKNAQLLDARDDAVDAAEAKSRLMAHISHEIRTPLQGILGMTEIMLYEESDPGRTESLTVLDNCGKMLLRIVNDVLDLSKADSANLELEKVSFALVEIVDMVINLYTTQAATKGISFGAEIDSDVPSVVSGDPVRLIQVLNNLVVNAIKFTDAGSVRLQVSSVANGDDGTVRFDVADTGVGLSELDCARVFEPFVQVSSTARRVGGTGLGLTICKRLAALMDGQLDVRSEIGNGSIFSLTIPMPPADRPSSSPPEQPREDIR